MNLIIGTFWLIAAILMFIVFVNTGMVGFVIIAIIDLIVAGINYFIYLEESKSK